MLMYWGLPFRSKIDDAATTTVVQFEWLRPLARASRRINGIVRGPDRSEYPAPLSCAGLVRKTRHARAGWEVRAQTVLLW